MQRPGLYFPFIHIRDDEWLKGAALYWPSIRRLVPAGYPKNDSPTARVFADARILNDADPAALIDGTAYALFKALSRNARVLARHYSVEHAYRNWDGRSWSETERPGHRPELGWIHTTKFPPRAIDTLTQRGLAVRGRDSESDPWVGVHPALAGAYMTALAGQLSQESFFEPVTDQADLRTATPNGDVASALNLLLGRTDVGRVPASDHTEAYVLLALQYACPRNLADVSANKIIECRQNMEEELTNFRRYVDEQQAELTQISAIPNRRGQLDAFVRHVEQTIELPLPRLEKSLKLHKLEPTRSMLLAGTAAPPAAVEAVLTTAHAPLIASTATATMAAIGSAWWQVETIRSAKKRESPVGYLLDVRDALTPATLPARVHRVLSGTYGSS